MRDAIFRGKPAEAAQLLPAEAYTSQAWFEREQRELFGRSWHFAGMAADAPNPGDYICAQAGLYPLFVMRQEDGALRAFHNICRHRGSLIVEGRGSAEGAVICPYHQWTYGLDGSLRGVTGQKALFPGLDKASLCLHGAAIGTFRGMVFVNPQADPPESFEHWLAGIPDHAWPHDVSRLVETTPTRYEIACNWKLFLENAMDGYHLAYLHDKTLKGPLPEDQGWDAVGRHWIFMGPGDSEARRESGAKPIEGVEYGAPGARVWLLFPHNGVQGTSVYWATFQTIPVAPDKTWVEVRSWVEPLDADDDPEAYKALFPTPGFEADPEAAMVVQSLAAMEGHPMDSGNFMLEDMWICERMQRAMASPKFAVGPMAPEVETPLTFFQQNILDFVPLD